MFVPTGRYWIAGRRRLGVGWRRRRRGCDRHLRSDSQSCEFRGLTRCERQRIRRAGDLLVALETGNHDLHLDEDDDEPKLFGERIDGSAQPCGTIAFDRILLEVGGRTRVGLALFADHPAPIAPLTVERQSPGHTNQPRPKAAAIAQAMKVAVGLDERVLCDILSILPMAQHSEGDADASFDDSTNCVSNARSRSASTGDRSL
jgi:hypothetical protein